MKEIILVDGKNLAYRSHFTHMNLASKGRETSVVHGMVSMLLNVQRKLRAPMVIVWDGGGKTWRHEILASRPRRVKKTQIAKNVTLTQNKDNPKEQYKGNRDPRSDHSKSISKQIEVLKKFFKLVGIWNFSIPHLEADDLIGILSHSLISHGYDRVIIYSTDRDFFQLISDKVWVWRPLRGEKRPTFVSPGFIQREWGVEPKDWAKMRALCGDKSDTIPSIKAGIGSVTASKMIQAGLDPSQQDFENMPIEVKEEFKELKPIWHTAYENFQLCRIIKKISNKNLKSDIKDQISDILSLVRDTGLRRDKSSLEFDAFRKMVEFIVDYDLDELYTRKQEIWDIP